ncbi:hypothetical protein JQ574_34160 [Bradyrhizobium sp. AUGA SZCCT0158]|uniref:hypothetical protein n=1 Tax=Bradyrhizobium sp. AUGA SZCCT0158 TaxID=2807661 RepID=UPI001BAC370A|nr:hypothetical protein [Bradyrhizobium sp. AUGA SZCCT0158]MBR1201049.1 hypothetical protein [Bradyrhizobium sp. AUGA SZCCT0158]
MLKNLDAYTVKARYYPALLATIPGLAALAILISWSRFGLTTIVASAAIPVLVFASADIARRLGKRIEERIYSESGGKPSVTMLRYSDSTFDAASKEQYRTFLSAKINQPTPTEDQERQDINSGDAFYERAGAWLRENTRDTKKFAVLFAENITYGFRRNLLGLKWPALSVNVALVLISGFFLYKKSPLNTDDDTTLRLLVVLVLAIVHSLLMAFGMNKKSVIDASRIYARQLILSCETLIAKDNKTSAKTTKKKG